jgi:translocation and assembly module TamB
MLRFLSKKRILTVLSIVVLLILALAGGLVVYISSPAFEEQARKYIIDEITRRTGAEVSLKVFNWNFREQRFRLEDLTLRGLEPPEEPPLAHFDRIDIGLNFRTLLERHIDLFELTLARPAFNLIVARDGSTNIPSTQNRGQGKPLNFQISIENFSIVDGMAIVNERQVNLEFSLNNLQSMLNYHSAREVLEAHLTFEGIFDRSAELRPSIPYSLSADVDYTRATLLAREIVVRTGKNEVKLQGKVDQILSKSLSGKLEYTGTVEVPFLNYFFRTERLAGNADVAGFLEFSPGYFFTRGKTSSDAVDFEDWRATNLTGDYAYHYPGRRLSFRNVKTRLIDGGVSGNVLVEHLPGPSRVLIDLDYAGVDGAALARAYPWDPKYRIFSRLTGTLNGWFEGRLARYVFTGHANLAAYNPSNLTNVVALPLDGSTDYRVVPGQAAIANCDVRFFSTSITASGLIEANSSDLAVTMTSSNLKDLSFLYSDANGSGSFKGALTGPISKPTLSGEFSLQDYKYQRWTIQQAQGGVLLDTASENVEFKNAHVTQGESEATVNGSIALSGTPANLRVQSDHITGKDLKTFIDRDVDGIFSGNVLITSLSPVRAEGDVRAANSIVGAHQLGDVRGHVRYFEPVIEVDQLSIRRGQATLAGNMMFNRATEALKFSGRLNNIDIHSVSGLGVPDSIKGVIRQADVRADGTTKRPNVRGNAVFQDLEVYGERFPQARVELASTGSKLDVKLSAANNVSLTAQVDTAAAGYPFTANATFDHYPLERIAGLSEGTVVATGSANLSGSLSDNTLFRGRGEIQSAEAFIQSQNVRTTKPFIFEFNSDRLTVTGVTLSGQATQVNLAGTVGLNARAPLNLNVSGRVDLALLSAAYPDWFSSGTVNVEGLVAGTVQSPDLRGLAHLANATFGRRGFFTSLSKVNGDLFFDQDRITLNNIEGVMGGGTVRAQGAALLNERSVQDMNIRIEGTGVRIRYPEGLRTIVDASLILRGSAVSPLLEGNLQIQNLAYRSSFEEFLAMMTERDQTPTATPLDPLRLAIHVEGSRNITIQNQLADVEARVDVDLKGTVAQPSLTGHIEASGGTLTFQGNRYSVTRGNIDFVDPLRIEPVVDVQAESEVRDYRIILTVSGRGDRLRLDLRSDPPLPELEIVSLIAGGRTQGDYLGRTVRPDTPTQEQLFQSGAASILFDLLQQRVGNRLGLFGLDRVRVDPFLVGAENNPGARITLSEQVTKDLSITYSQDLSSNRQQIIQIEYFVNRNTSILASRDELGNFGLDVRLRKRF